MRSHWLLVVRNATLASQLCISSKVPGRIANLVGFPYIKIIIIIIVVISIMAVDSGLITVIYSLDNNCNYYYCNY